MSEFTCQCGARFRNAYALATHLNNFPMFCKRKKKPKKRVTKTGSATAKV
jgi:hypothetical protein